MRNLDGYYGQEPIASGSSNITSWVRRLALTRGRVYSEDKLPVFVICVLGSNLPSVFKLYQKQQSILIKFLLRICESNF
jgi:hypothetical protein